MPRKASRDQPPRGGPRRVQAKIRLKGGDQLPLYVNHLTVNYVESTIGEDFVLTLAHVAFPAFLDAANSGS